MVIFDCILVTFVSFFLYLFRLVAEGRAKDNSTCSDSPCSYPNCQIQHHKIVGEKRLNLPGPF